MARHSSIASPLPAARGAGLAALPLGRLASERARLALVLLIALCQGALYLCLLPPWQHYDEPTHFEYAWLIANRPGLPHAGDEDQAMRRDLAASMLARRFYWNLEQPRLLTDTGPIDVGVTELGHPPGYYLLVSLPLRLARHLDLESQLYLARGVSLLLFVLTVAFAAGTLRELTPPGHDLRWAVPLAIALLPPFADLMTAVNNDVGAVAVFSLFLWGAVRTIRQGLGWRRVAWVFGTALLAVATKNTAALALALAPLACLVAFWTQRGWRWRWLVVGVATALALALPLLFGWGDAAYWYRGNPQAVQAEATRATTPQAPLGQHALQLMVPAGGANQMLLSPLAGVSLQRLGGQPVTVGAWVWADTPDATAYLGVAYKTPSTPWAALQQRQVAISTVPTFVALTLDLPPQTMYLHYQISLHTPAGAAATRMFADGMVLAEGAFPLDQAPRFDDSRATAGIWAGRSFANLLRNPSADAGWPRLRAVVDRLLVRYIHRSPAQSIAALFDVWRVAPIFFSAMLLPATDSFVQSFAWSNVRLRDPIWLYLSRYLALLALLGGLRWLLSRRSAGLALRPAALFLLLVGLLIWANTLLRPLPLLGELYVVPAARYTYPAIIVSLLALVGGWRALWGARWRTSVTFGLIVGLIILNGVSIQTIWWFYQTLPPVR
ncbi:MAG TPA: hypothetical protein PLO33_08310 [Kouleothrix sp.]|uniref:hypothetical protein n=1 Tax=Kouleothrix sp. TaxID=2779161 RepID=UPI002D1690CB|nr:hypothetical protein [Kouleothrix sp.]HRC75667.1 hypothetical protein [Kouleothrix sp.]